MAFKHNIPPPAPPTNFEQETQRGGQERVSQVVGLAFKICQQLPKNAFLGVVWVTRTSMEGSICIGTSLDDEQTPLITV